MEKCNLALASVEVFFAEMSSFGKKEISPITNDLNFYFLRYQQLSKNIRVKSQIIWLKNDYTEHLERSVSKFYPL